MTSFLSTFASSLARRLNLKCGLKVEAWWFDTLTAPARMDGPKRTIFLFHVNLRVPRAPLSPLPYLWHLHMSNPQISGRGLPSPAPFRPICLIPLTTDGEVLFVSLSSPHSGPQCAFSYWRKWNMPSLQWWQANGSWRRVGPKLDCQESRPRSLKGATLCRLSVYK